MICLGLLSFYLTLNPGNILNPVVKLLAGANIDVDHLLQEDAKILGAVIACCK